MSSLRSINKEAGTSFRRWKEVGPAIKEGEQAKAEVEVMKAAEPVPIAEVDETMEAVNCAKCGGTLHAEGNYPNLFRCGTCNTVQKLEPTPTPEVPEAEPAMAKPTPKDEPIPEPWPPKLSDRVAYQMRGKGFTVEDGWPISGGRGTFTTSTEKWKYDDDGQVFLVWNHHPWNVQRDSMYLAIIDQPLVRAGDGSPAPSMFEAHHGWIDNMSEYRQKKLDAVKSGVFAVAQERVAWFQDGVPIYQTTIGALLEQSLSLRAK